MIIKFLGTSAAWPLPRLGCNCQVCSSLDPKDKRGRSAILIDNFILIDAGPDIYKQLINNNPEKLDSVLITHHHPDHILGIHDLGHIYNRNSPLKIFSPKPVINQIKAKFDYNLNPLKLIPVNEQEAFQIGNYKVTFFPVEHVKQSTYGIKVKMGKFLAYIPDIAKLPKKSADEIKDCHLLIIDGSSLDKIGHTKSHITIIDGINLSKKIKAKLTYFTHLGHKIKPHFELETIVKKLGGKSFNIAYDGLIVKLE